MNLLATASERITSQRPVTIGVTASVAEFAIEDVYPLSPIQRGMLFNALSETEAGVDIEQVHCALNEALDVTAFRRAWEYVASRHAVLRTAMRWEGLERAVQQVATGANLPWEEHDCSRIPTADLDDYILRFLAADRRRGFDLARAPLCRINVLRRGIAESHVIWTYHHTILDGPSSELVLREVFECYEALRSGRATTWEMARPYKDYVLWLNSQDFRRHEPHWRDTLRGFVAPTPLGFDHPARSLDDGYPRKGTTECALSAPVTAALRALAKDGEFTLGTIIEAVWALVLSCYSGETDVVFGVIRGARRSTIEGVDRMAGVFVNTLPLRIRLDFDVALIPWLRDVRRRSSTVRNLIHCPLANVQASSGVPAGTPLFLSTVMFEKSHLDASLRLQGGKWQKRRFRRYSQTNYPLDVTACDGPELALRIDFDRTRVDADVAERLVRQMRTLLEEIAADSSRAIGELSPLSRADRHLMLTEWNRSSCEIADQTTTIHSLVEAQAERRPEAIAIQFEDRQLSYAELNRRSNQLAHYLRLHGVGPDVLVGVYAERSVDLVVALLGVLKAGGAYVPFDTSYPPARVAFMLDDAGASILLTQTSLVGALPRVASTRIFMLDEPGLADGWSQANPPRAATGTNLAYLMYTSGSTGQPKGALIPHRAVINHLRWMQARFAVDEQDCVLQKTESSFDVSVWEFFGPLVAGARLVLIRPGGQRDPHYLVDTIIRRGVTLLQLVPSLLRLLIDEPAFRCCSSLRHVFCGGERMPEDVPARFFSVSDAQLHNMYGPTEATIDALYYTVPRAHVGGAVPIGRPLPNTQAYVLNRRCQAVPVGVAGELYLGGVQVARGYHNRHQLNARSFVPDVFTRATGARLYRTGDRVRYRPDGNIEFLGRMDEQVKIRGVRVEPGEIESTLRQHPEVEDCMVIARAETADRQRLVAYVVPARSSNVSASSLRSFLKERLLSYLVPAAFVLLEALPTSSNGKTDRSQLPDPQDEDLVANETHVDPRTPTEEALAASWRKALGVGRIGIHENFFEYGGDSLLLVQLITEVNQVHQVNLGISDVLQNPTIAHVARLVDGRRPIGPSLSRIVPFVGGTGDLPLYFIQPGADEFRLGQQMDGDHPIFGIEALWPESWRRALEQNRKEAYPIMEQLVDPYVEALSAHPGSSPCILAGFSFSGLIAFEVARAFQRRGGVVDAVVIIDVRATGTVPPNLWRHALCMWLRGWTAHSDPAAGRSALRQMSFIARNSMRTTGWLVGKGRDRMQRVVADVRKATRRHLAHPDLEEDELSTQFDERGDLLSWKYLNRLYDEIDQTYRPRPLNARGILLRTGTLLGRHQDDSMGWGDLFGKGLEIRSIAGDHASIFAANTVSIASAINAAIGRH